MIMLKGTVSKLYRDVPDMINNFHAPNAVTVDNSI